MQTTVKFIAKQLNAWDAVSCDKQKLYIFANEIKCISYIMCFFANESISQHTRTHGKTNAHTNLHKPNERFNAKDFQHF